MTDEEKRTQTSQFFTASPPVFHFIFAPHQSTSVLSGGHTHGSIRNGLYVISTWDFSTTLLQTSGQVPNPRYGHRAALTSTVLLIWGGITSGQVMQNQDPW